jgi:anthranilate synthase component II
MAKILILDNYDSFTYNLVHYVKEHPGYDVDVYRNDKISMDEVDRYDGILLSPGPGIPSEAGLLLPIIERYSPLKRIFGVCLGQQAIGEVFGGKLINLSRVFHGVATPVELLQPKHYLFEGLPDKIEAGRYHSWSVDEKGFPDTLQITARDESGQIMGLCHKTYDVCGVQFHPESILTPDGKKIIYNWLKNF